MMLIINSDDWGKNQLATNNILWCYTNKRVTSISAMVFLKDSERSAKLAIDHDMDVGLHVNFTHKFVNTCINRKLDIYQQEISGFLLRNNFGSYLYNPFLKNQFEYVFNSQFEEFLRLYKKPPTHINGHLHMHLCMNMLIDRIIPTGSKLRRNFTFFKGEKNYFKRSYRRFADKWLSKRYRCTDFFFDVSPINFDRLMHIINLSKNSNVEIMTHPERSTEYHFLMSKKYSKLLSGIVKGTYANI